MKLEWACGMMAIVAGLATRTVQAGEPVPAADARVTYEGRYAVGEGGSVRLGFPGVTAHLRFHGKRLTVRLKASEKGISFDSRVDGGGWQRVYLEAGEGTYTVFDAAGAGDHEVALLRCDESWVGTYDLLAFDPGPDGTVLEPPRLPARRMMFIGDSVTCGAMDAWEPGMEMHLKANSDARLSYGMILASRLGAQCHLVSYGGRGIVRDWQGIRDTGNAPQFYELARPDDPAVAWNPASYVPDAIGIQLGTNDFNQGVPDQNEFVNTYVEFIRKVLRDAPAAWVFVMDSPIVGDDAVKGPRRTVLHAYLEQIVARVRQPRVVVAPLRVYPGVPGNGHPTGAEHVAMADALEPAVRRALGW